MSKYCRTAVVLVRTLPLSVFTTLGSWLPSLLKPVILRFVCYSDYTHHIYGHTQRNRMKCSRLGNGVWRTCTIKHIVNMKNAKSGKNRG